MAVAQEAVRQLNKKYAYINWEFRIEGDETDA